MANLRPERTGLPFIVFISQTAALRHDVRVQVAAGPRVLLDQMGSYALRPLIYEAGYRLSSQDEALLEQGVNANRQVLIEYWNGGIAYTKDVLNRIIPV